MNERERSKMAAAHWYEPRTRPAMLPADRVVGALGWLSLALGFAEVVAPRAVTRAVGASRPTLVRSYGVREIAAGMGLLTGRRTGFWLWARVIGDVLDLASLARMLGRDNPRRATATIAFASVALVTLLDLYCAQIESDGIDDHAWRR